jgi:HEAT repeat protein
MFVPTAESLVRVCLVGVTAHVATSIMLIATRLGHKRRLRVLERAEQQLNGRSQEMIDNPNAGRRLALDTLAHAPLEDVMLLARDAHAHMPRLVIELLAQSLLARLGAARLLEAARSRRGSWRRIAALRTLALARSDRSWDRLACALADGNREVKAATVTLLGHLGDRRSATLLVGAMRTGLFQRSRIAASLDAFPIDVSDLVAPLIASDDALVRFWATTLMQRYPQTPGLGRQLIALTGDPEPIVRKAAIDALVATGGVGALTTLRARLTDEVPFVRAHAARSLGRLQAASQSRALLPLLADRDWSVRDAAKESLGAMGAAISATVLPFLSHADAFARNGAAEVLQNMGVFERLVALEAEGPSDPARFRTIHLLARAGGAAMWDSVVDRLNIEVRPRAQQLFASMNLPRPPVQAVA